MHLPNPFIAGRIFNRGKGTLNTEFSFSYTGCKVNNPICPIGLVGRVFANGLRELGSIPGRVIPKALKMVLDTSLLNTHQYKVRIMGKVEQFKERSTALPNTLV